MKRMGLVTPITREFAQQASASSWQDERWNAGAAAQL